MEQLAEGLRSLEELKAKLADLEAQKAAIERERASFEDHENYLAGLEAMAGHLARDLPSWLEGWGGFRYRIVANKDGTLDTTFGANGEAHLPPGYKRPEPVPISDPSNPVWDAWKEGDHIPAPTGGDVLQK